MDVLSNTPRFRKHIFATSLAINAIFLITVLFVFLPKVLLRLNKIGNPLVTSSEWQSSTYYTGRVRNFRALPVCENKHPVMFLGDSHIAWGNWDERLRDVGATVLVRGIVADTSDGVLARLNEVTRHQPRALFLCVGVNDLLASPTKTTVDHVLERTQAIVEQVRRESPQTKIFIEAVFLVEPNRFPDANCPPDLPKRIAELNKRLSTLADNNTVSFLDLNAALAQTKPPYTVDGIHLLPHAYAAWESAIRKRLSRL